MEETDEKQENGYQKKPLWQWVLIYLVVGGVIYALVYYFFLAKKGGYNYNQSSTIYPTQSSVTLVPSEKMMVKEMTIVLAEENNSGESGTASLKEENGKVTVTVNLTGYQKDISQPAHIHFGACPGVGEVKYPLNSVVKGVSTTVLPVTLVQLKKDLPLALNVHKSKTEISVYTACGELNAK